MKDIIFLGSSKNDLRDFPDAARRDSGIELYQVQLGLDPSDWKPMPRVSAPAFVKSGFGPVAHFA